MRLERNNQRSSGAGERGRTQPLQGSRRELNNVLEAAGLEQLLDGLLNEVEAAARRAGESLDSSMR